MKKNLIKRGQLWMNKETKVVVRIMRKATGNLHWTLNNGHHIHEGTLQKFYEQISGG